MPRMLPGRTQKRDEQPDALDALKHFKAKVKQKMVLFWKTAPELRAQFVESLSTTINIKPRRRWVRAPEATDTDIAQALSNLTEENARLRKELNDSKQFSGARGRVDDIIDVTSREILDSGDEQVDGDKVVVDLINYIRQNGDHVWETDIYRYLSDFDSHQIRDFLDQLVILNVLRKRSGAYTASEISGDIYAKLVLRQ